MRDICHFVCYKCSTTATTTTTITQRAFKKNEYDCFNSAFAGAGRDCYDHLIACPGNALQGPARRTGTPPPPASHVATGCPCTSRLQLLCIKQIETSTSMLQKKAGSETMRADRLQIALHAARRLSNVDRPPSRILQAGRASREKFRVRRCDYSESPWAMNRSCNSAVNSRTLALPSRKKASIRRRCGA